MNEEMLYAAISEIKQGLDSLLRSGLSANARAIKINELKKALDDLVLNVRLFSSELRQKYIETRGALDRAEDEIDSDLFLKRKGADDEPSDADE